MFASSLAHLAEDTCFFFRDASCGLVEMGASDTAQADCYFIHESDGVIASEDEAGEDVPSAEYCSAGVTAGNVCCAGDCDGVCGGDDCHLRPGGGDRCCWGAITAAGKTCTGPDDVACIMPAENFFPSEPDLGVEMDGEEVSTGVFVKEISAMRFLSLGDTMELYKGPGADVPDGVGVPDLAKKYKDYQMKDGYAQAVFIVYAHNDTTINLAAEVLYPDGKANSFWVWFDRYETKTLSTYSKAGYATDFTWRTVTEQHLNDKNAKATDFQVTQGFHTLHFGCREDGTYLRKLRITAGDADFIEGNAAFTLANEGKICLSKSGGFRYARWEHGCQGDCDADGDGPGPCNLQCCRETCAMYDWCSHFTWFTNDACRLYDKCDAVVDGYAGAVHEQIYAKLMKTKDLIGDQYELPALLLE
jgi:hypothetical protein